MILKVWRWVRWEDVWARVSGVERVQVDSDLQATVSMEGRYGVLRSRNRNKPERVGALRQRQFNRRKNEQSAAQEQVPM